MLLFLLAKEALPYLPTALTVALRPLLLFHQAKYSEVFPLKPAPFWKLIAGLGNTNRSAISLLFSYLTLVLSSPPCLFLRLSFYLKFFGTSGRNCLFFSIKLQWVVGNDAAVELVCRGALFAPTATPCSLSLISHIHSCLISD